MSSVQNDSPSKVDAELVAQVNLLIADVADLRTKLAAAIVDLAAIRTGGSAHTHGGVTTGSDTSSASGSIAALTASAPAAATATAVTVVK